MESLTIGDVSCTRINSRTGTTSRSGRPRCSHIATGHPAKNHPNFDGHRQYRFTNAPIDHLERRRTRNHPEHPRPTIVRCYSEYTHHLNAGATTLIIDSGPDHWLDLGHIPDSVDVTITGQTCAAVTGGTITAAGRCFLHATNHARVTACDFAHVEAFDTTTIDAHGESRIVGTDHADIRADEHAIVFAHCHCHVHAAGHTRIAATDTTTVDIDGNAQVHASTGVRITGDRQSTNLTIDTLPINRLADHLNR